MIDYSTLQDYCYLMESKKTAQKYGLMNEATYYGRNDKLIACEEQLQIIIDECHHNPLNFVDTKCRKAFSRIEEILKELFQFDSVSINDDSFMFYNSIKSGITTNGSKFNKIRSAGKKLSGTYTICDCYIYRYTKYVIYGGKEVETVSVDDNHDTVRLKNGFGYSCRICIGAGNFSDYGENSLTAQEIMATILHEIGHNFYRSPAKELVSDIYDLIILKSHMLTCDEIQKLAYAVVFVNAANNIMLSQLYDIILRTCGDIINYIPGAKQVIGTLSKIINLLGTTFESIYIPIKGIINHVKLITKITATLTNTVKRITPHGIIKSTISYDREKYADAFVTAYGYGPYQVSGLYKIEKHEYTLPYINTPLVTEISGWIYTIGKLVYLPLFFVSSHPQNTSREKKCNKLYERSKLKKSSSGT